MSSSIYRNPSDQREIVRHHFTNAIANITLSVAMVALGYLGVLGILNVRFAYTIVDVTKGSIELLVSISSIHILKKDFHKVKQTILQNVINYKRFLKRGSIELIKFALLNLTIYRLYNIKLLALLRASSTLFLASSVLSHFSGNTILERLKSYWNYMLTRHGMNSISRRRYEPADQVELERLKGAIRDLKDQLQEAQDNAKNIRKQLDNALSELHHTEAQIKAQARELQIAQGKVADLIKIQDKLRILRSSVSDQRSRASLQSELQQALESKPQIESSQIDHNQTLDLAIQELDSLKSDLGEASDLIIELRRNIDSLEQTNSQLADELYDLKIKKEHFESLVKDIQQKLNKHGSGNSQLNTSKNGQTLIEQIEELARKFPRLEREIEQINSIKKELEEELASETRNFETRLSELKKNHQSAQKDLNKKSKELESLKSQFKKVSNERVEIIKKLQNVRKEKKIQRDEQENISIELDSILMSVEQQHDAHLQKKLKEMEANYIEEIREKESHLVGLQRQLNLRNHQLEMSSSSTSISRSQSVIEPSEEPQPEELVKKITTLERENKKLKKFARNYCSNALLKKIKKLFKSQIKENPQLEHSLEELFPKPSESIKMYDFGYNQGSISRSSLKTDDEASDSSEASDPDFQMDMRAPTPDYCEDPNSQMSMKDFVEAYYANLKEKVVNLFEDIPPDLETELDLIFQLQEENFQAFEIANDLSNETRVYNGLIGMRVKSLIRNHLGNISPDLETELDLIFQLQEENLQTSETANDLSNETQVYNELIRMRVKSLIRNHLGNISPDLETELNLIFQLQEENLQTSETTNDLLEDSPDPIYSSNTPTETSDDEKFE